MKSRVNKRWLFKRIFPLASLLLAGLVFVSCTPGTVARGWSGGTISNNTIYIGSMSGKLLALRTSDGSQVWNAPLISQAPSGGGFGCAPAAAAAVPIYGSPAVSGDLTYVGGYDGVMYAYSANTGALRWVYPRQGTLGSPIVGGAVITQGTIYFGTGGGKAYSLDAATGDKRWESVLGGKIWSTPAVSGDTVFIGSFDGKLYALSTTDGSKKWEFTAKGAIATTPLVHDNKVYIGSFDRHLYAIDTTSGSETWRFPVDDGSKDAPKNWFWAEPVISGNILYAPNLDGKVYAINVQSGQMLAILNLGHPANATPVVTNGLLVIATEDGIVYAFDINSQQQKWVNDELKTDGQKIYASLVTDGQVVFIHTTRGELRALNVQSGAKLWSLPLKSL